MQRSEASRPQASGPERSSVSKNLEGPSTPIPPVVPKPQHLSKTATPLTNDPLWMECFVIDGDRGLTEDAGEQKFTVTTDSFVSLTKRTYDNVCAADKEFNRHVSLSMYHYYNTIHLWARLAAIREHTGLATEDEHNLRRYVSSNQYPLHEPVNAYLRGIGDFEDPSGTEHKYRLLRLPGREEYEGIAGYFGQVSDETHHLYESLPSPGVAAQRVVADLNYTLGQGAKIWDMPDDLRPEEEIDEEVEDEEEEEIDEAIPEVERHEGVPEAVRPLPTANLLGWSPAVRLTNEQRQVLENCGVQEEGFADHLVRFALNNGLFESVADRIRTSADRYKCGASLHEHQSGSLTQCLFVEKEDRQVAFSRTKMYCEGSIRAAGAYQLDARMSVAARVMAYRMKPPRWCFHLIVVRGFEYARDPESYTSGSVATGRACLAGQVKG
jgi:hypothetical protein